MFRLAAGAVAALAVMLPVDVAACRRRRAPRSTTRFTPPPMENEPAAACDTRVTAGRMHLW
jgi:hypothetical protein